jgi:hypothetical protein
LAPSFSRVSACTGGWVFHLNRTVLRLRAVPCSKEIVPMKRPKPGTSARLAHLHAAFLLILPGIERHGRIYFRHLGPHRKADAIQEMRALAWMWFVRLHQRGKNPADFVTTFSTLLARAVNSGRRLAGMAKAKDVMNPLTQRRHGFKVEPLHASTRVSHVELYGATLGQRRLDAFEERLRDNTITPVADQVQFRIDWPAWLKTLTGRERRLIRAMGLNERTLDLSRQFGLSPARISQLRREFFLDWHRFLGDLA